MCFGYLRLPARRTAGQRERDREVVRKRKRRRLWKFRVRDMQTRNFNLLIGPPVKKKVTERNAPDMYRAIRAYRERGKKTGLNTIQASGQIKKKIGMANAEEISREKRRNVVVTTTDINGPCYVREEKKRNNNVATTRLSPRPIRLFGLHLLRIQYILFTIVETVCKSRVLKMTIHCMY